MKHASSWFEKLLHIMHVAYMPMQIAYIVSLALTAIATFPIFAYLISFAGNLNNTHKDIIYGFAATIFALISSWVFKKYYNSRTRQKARELYGDPNIYWISSENTLIVKNDDKYQYKRKIKIKAKTAGVKEFKIYFGYLGRNINIQNCSGVSLREGVIPHNFKRWIFLDFDNSLEQGETCSFEIVVDIDDCNDKKMRKIFSYTSVFPIEETVIQTIEFQTDLPTIIRSNYSEKIDAVKGSAFIDITSQLRGNKISITHHRPAIDNEYNIIWS